MADDPVVTPFATTDQQAAIANAGAGPLSDLARQAPKGGMVLDSDRARCFGAGFVPDLFRGAYITPGPPFPTVTHSVDIASIANTFQPSIKVAAADYPLFPIGSRVAFATTGIPLLDSAQVPFVIVSVDKPSNSFKINTDLTTAIAAPVLNTGRVGVLKFAVTLFDVPPAPAPKAEPYIPNGYEQAYADMAKEQKRGKEND